MEILQIVFKALEVVADVAVLVLAVKMIRERNNRIFGKGCVEWERTPGTS